LVLSTNRLIRLVSNTPAGILYDRFGHRKLYLAGLWLAVLSTAGYAVSRSLGPLLLARILWGLSWSLILVGAYTIILDTTTPDNRGSVMGTFQMAYFSGGGLGLLFGGVVTDLMGYRPAFWLCALISLLGAVLATALLPETSRREDARTPDLSSVLRTFWMGVRALAATGKEVIRRSFGLLGGHSSLASGRVSPLLAGSLTSFAVYFVGNGVLMSTLAYYIQQAIGDSVVLGPVVLGVSMVSGGLLSSRALFSILLAPFSGKLSDRIAERRHLVLGGFGLQVLGFALLASPMSRLPLALAGGVALIASGGGIVAPALAAWVADRAEGPNQSASMGMYATGGDGGSAAGPLVAYAVAAWWNMPAAYVLCVLVLGLSAVALLATRQDTSRGTSGP